MTRTLDNPIDFRHVNKLTRFARQHGLNCTAVWNGKGIDVDVPYSRQREDGTLEHGLTRIEYVSTMKELRDCIGY